MAVNQIASMKFANSIIICHRIPDRCFKFKGKPMPMCARCLGASIGHISAFILFLFGLLPNFYISLLFMAIILFDWSLQFFHILPSTNYRRLLTGILGGIGVGSCIWSLLFMGISLFGICF